MAVSWARCELGRLDVGDGRLEVLVVVGGRPAAHVHGQDLLVELLGFRRQRVRVAASRTFRASLKTTSTLFGSLA
ncbi:MAG: hypothetical protein MZV64_63050 [Ignavibacteriales bacterium]|nr:hypothetical protein [Ignavibacteriales bacterium]